MSSEDSNDPSEMGQASAYAQLLKQIESLKIELGSLKSELDFKTAQISRLELEAACLKEHQPPFGHSNEELVGRPADKSLQQSYFNKCECQKASDTVKKKQKTQNETSINMQSDDICNANLGQFEQHQRERTLEKAGVSARERNAAKSFNMAKCLFSRMPSGLAEKMQHANNDFSMEDDNPINYSLQFTETELTPSAPRFSEYPNNSRSPFAQSLHANHCTSGKTDQKNFPSSHSISIPKINFTVKDKVLSADCDTFGNEDTPTNFGAIFNEECLNEECLEDYSSQQLGKPAVDSCESTKCYNVEDTPICFSPHSSLSELRSTNLSCKTQEKSMIEVTNVRSDLRNKTEECPSDEEGEDKFDLEPGVITPAQYFKSNRHSGLMTPRTPMCQDTPLMMYSPCESRSSLDSCDQASICSDVSSEPESRLQSGCISPSELPDSPGQSVPQSRCSSPCHNSKGKEKDHNQKTVMIDTNNLNNVEVVNESGSKYSKFPLGLIQHDEVKHYDAEPAMSVMTDLSEITVDGEKFSAQKCPDFPTEKMLGNPAHSSENTNNNHRSEDSLMKGGKQTTLQAGYVTSLPASDEIKLFHFEGAMSPMTSALSEISGLNSHNDGFQKSHCLAVDKFKLTDVSNHNSYTSRSSATGASNPLSPKIHHQEAENDHLCGKTDKAGTAQSRNNDSAISNGSNKSATTVDMVTNQKSSVSLSPHSNSRQGCDENSLQKNVFSVTQTKLESNLQNAGYYTSLPSCDEIKLYKEEGTMSPLTTLSDISMLKSQHDECQKKTFATSSDYEYRTKSGDADPHQHDNESSTNNCLDNNAMDTSDFLDSSTDDDGLLELVIKSAIPKNRSNNRSKTAKASGSSNREKKSGNHVQSNKTAQKSAIKKTTNHIDVVNEDNGVSNSSLSSLGSEEGSKLLHDCISSAMPVARRDFASIPPKQLIEQDQAMLSRIDFLHSPDKFQNTDIAAVNAQASTSRSMTHFNELNASELAVDMQSSATRNELVSDSSNGSLKLGGDAKSLMKLQNKTKNYKSSVSYTSVPEASKKLCNGKEKPQDFCASHSKDSSKSSSSKRNHTSESCPSACSKCNPAYKLPSSLSVNRLENAPRRRRKSSHSKAVVAACGHVVDVRKPVHARSANHYSGVTQIYPRLKEIDSIVLTGVASMAARGEKVHCDGGQWVPVHFAPGYATHCSALPTSFFLNQSAFFQSQPDKPVLLGNYDNNTCNSAEKQQLSSKKKKSWKSRIKKFISPASDTKSVNSDKSSKKSSSQKSLSELTPKQSTKIMHRKGLSCPTNGADKRGSSSLSLSSSDEESDNYGLLNAYEQVHSRSSIYPTVSSITSNHIPKSPVPETDVPVINSSFFQNYSTSASLKSDDENTPACS